MASAVVLAYSDREGADQLAVILRELGIAAAVVPEEDGRFPGGMAWAVRVPEADVENVRRILRAIVRARATLSATPGLRSDAPGPILRPSARVASWPWDGPRAAYRPARRRTSSMASRSASARAIWTCPMEPSSSVPSLCTWIPPEAPRDRWRAFEERRPARDGMRLRAGGEPRHRGPVDAAGRGLRMSVPPWPVHPYCWGPRSSPPGSSHRCATDPIAGAKERRRWAACGGRPSSPRRASCRRGAPRTGRARRTA